MNQIVQETQHINQIMEEKIKKINELREEGIDPFGTKYDKRNMIGDLLKGESENGVEYKEFLRKLPRQKEAKRKAN